MKIENVTGIRFTARRTTQQKAHLAVGNGLLRQVIIDDQRVHAVIAEIFAHGTGCVRGEELHWCRIGRGGGDDDRIFERALLFQRTDDLRHGRALLANSNIDAEQLLAVVLASSRVYRLLVDEGVDGNGGLAGLAVANDQLTLATANRDQAVDRLQAGLHRLVNRFTRHDAGGLHLDAAAGYILQRALAVNRVAKRVNNAAKKTFANRRIHNRCGPANNIAFLDGAVITEDHDADIVRFKVQRHSLDAALEFDHLAGLDFVKTMYARDAVTNGQDTPDLRNLGVASEIGNLFLQDC